MNTCIKCGCDDAYPSLPPCPAPADCPNPQPCAEFFDAQCITYTLPNITCGEDIVVYQDDTLVEALNNIVTYFCNNSGSYVLPIASPTVLGGVKIGSGLTIDGSGVLSTTGGGIAGSGTNNYVARWTPNGSTLGTGLIQDDNSTVSIGGAPDAGNKLTISSDMSIGLVISQSVGGKGADIRSVTAGALPNWGIFSWAGNSTFQNIGADIAVTGGTTSANIGVRTQVSGGLNNYGAQFEDGTEGVGKVLTCVTANGKANWVSTNLQKEITANHVLTDLDNDYTIFINNSTTPISISLGTITIPNFSVGFVQEGSADVTFTGVMTNPIGLKLKGQGYQAFIERKLATTTYYLLGNTKA